MRNAIFDPVFVKRKQISPDARLGGARAIIYFGVWSSQVCLSAMVPAFAEPDIHSLSRVLVRPSQKIEYVFSASPETIRREPQE